MGAQFYSYLWLREDGSPYYVGKGTGRRAFQDEGHITRCPRDCSRILVFPMVSEAEAFESEIALIELFGRKDKSTGCLRNLTDGGEGATGHIHSEETKTKMRLSPGNQHFRGCHHTLETRIHWSAIRAGKRPAAHTLTAANTANRGRKRSLETRAKMVESAKHRPPSPLRHRHRPDTVLKRAWDTRFTKTVAWG